ncbi:PblA [Ignavigranum ruoffiae]|uniref:phage tail protein n=1 Tax=Ignavigranum ruoffiae TaxID=89093 RepID=UPI00399A7A65
MVTDLGQAYVQIIPSARGIKGSITQALGPESAMAGAFAGTKIGTKMISALTGIISTAAIGKAISDSITEGAALEQSIGGIETLFKGHADKVKTYADEAYKTAGLSANSYMENVTSFSASLLQSLGGDTSKAADVANMAMIDMADNANKMGTSIESIQDAYQGFAKQNYTMLDNLKLGYGGTKSEMERLLADAEKLTGVKYDINNLSDVYNAIHAIQGKLEITGATADEAEKTFSGSLAAMKASYKNVLGKLALGEDIKPSLKALAETTSTFLLDNFFPMVGNILKGLPTLFVGLYQEFVPRLMELGGKLIEGISQGLTTGLPKFLESFSTVFSNVLTWITSNLPMLLEMGVQILTNIANGILQALPLLITIAGQLIVQFVQFMMTNIPVILQAGADLILNLVTGIIQNLPAIGESAINVVSSFIDVILSNYPQYLSSGRNIITNLINGIISLIPSLIATAASLAVQFIAMILSHIPQIISAGIEIIASLIEGITGQISSVLDIFTKLGSDIISSVQNINLWDAGSAIMNSLLNGLKSAWENVKGFFSRVTSSIPKLKGPLPYDKRMLIPNGKAIMTGLYKGLNENFRYVKESVSSMAGAISKELTDNIDLNKFNLDHLKTLKIKPIIDNGSLDLNNVKKEFDTNAYFGTQLTPNSFYSNRDKNTDEYLESIINKLTTIVNKDSDLYMDSKKVSREIDEPLRRYQQIQDRTNKRILGAW